MRQGTQVSISTELFADVPPFFFLPLDLSSVWCVLAIWWTVPSVFALLRLHPAWFRPMASLCGHVGRRRAHSTMALALCVVCASPRGVCVDRRRACPHRRDVGVLVHSRCQWCRDRIGHNGFARLCVCGNRGRRAHNGYPEDRGGLDNEGTMRWCHLVHLCRCGDGP